MRYRKHLKLMPIDGLPDPPEAELQDLLHTKLEVMDGILRDAERRFDPHAIEELPPQLAISPWPPAP